ncbi:hypothetical protein C9374_003280 [Naegleria lovaniensis]|uniref:M7GpppX diphosphatase n=1 Tax=Naegleria lovaniensis TaxID=51637 RepID=A0AA88KJB9_NAELO|nr:uncharacterized protein C9374_003280 [Naegleria lovaniensis]KAG2385465.1 hypothetical protein C9374_003280 [Naegleria lovaniensis]
MNIHNNHATLPFSIADDFKLERLLGYNAQQKVISLLGNVNGVRTILVMEKTQFAIDSEEAIKKWLARIKQPNGQDLQQVIVNDKYYMLNLPVQENDHFNLLNTSIIFPADESDIIKYSMQSHELFLETPSLYKEVTRPFLDKIPKEHEKWVDNLLQKQSEVEHMIYEDTESEEDLRFMLHPDMKYDKVDRNQLYCIAFCFNNEIKTLRDLSTERHLKMLKNVRDKGCQVIEQKFGIPREKLRIFVHYLPSFFRFHVHFTNVDNTSVNNGVERAHLLDDIIENMEVFGLNFYQRKTLTITLKGTHGLYPFFKERSTNVDRK